MSKIDLRKDLKHLYNPSRKDVTVVDVPPMSFLMIDGQGDPNTSPAYQQAMEALYATSYALKFALKPQGVDYVVMPPEGLWWTDDMARLDLEAKGRWQWTVMIMQPKWVTADLVERVRQEVARKKDLPALPRMRFETYHEGLSVQIMYVGAYADEGPTIARLHAFAEAQGYQLRGKHHEIYLSDPRRTLPEKLKTVIRQPIRD